ncbi:MAG: discoidin domain-containing protein [Planctomycetia bacterium]|nr:discoidin domain-containing protein [Planctomycetia bacterium]
MKKIILGALLACFCGTVFAEETNLAQGKKYTLQPRPAYSHCTDADDVIQLTDGQTTQSYFWTQKGTVGWVHSPYAEITLDLEATYPVEAVEFTSAAGVAGVQWPLSVMVLTSVDGKAFYRVADLMDTTDPLPEKYGIHRFRSKPLNVRARFVRLVGIPSGTFFFTDEIRVLQGDESQAKEPGGTDESDTKALVQAIRQEMCLAKRLRDDVVGVRKVIEESSLSVTRKAALVEELESLTQPDWVRSTGGGNFTTRFPITKNHAKIYDVLGRVWKELGCRDVTVAAANVWDPVERFCVPKDFPKAALTVPLLRGESRTVALNIYTTEPNRSLFLKLDGLSDVADVEVYGVVWTDTSVCQPVASAMEPLAAMHDGRYRIPQFSGLVQQVCLRVTPRRGGTFSGKETIRGTVTVDDVEIPLTLVVYPIDFPKETSLLVGGWDYLSGKGTYSVNETNMASFLEYVKSRHMNAPWAGAGVLAKVEVAADGSVLLDTAEFDQWVARFPDAKEYFVFLGKGGWSSRTTPEFLGTKAGTPEFDAAVGRWLGAWKKHWEAIGFDPSRLSLLIHDEPNEGTDVTGLLHWMRAIHAACPELKIWEDPCYNDFTKLPEALFANCDTLCPNRPAWLTHREAFDKTYPAWRDRGKTLHLYSCSGPMKTLDPYSYNLLQAWHAAKIGAKASFFWALGDGSGVSSWNEYALGRNAYTPLFIDPESSVVTPGKQMEAIGESAQDYEILQMAIRKNAAETERILDEMLNAPGADKIEWSAPKDRTMTEKARVRLLELLIK